MSHEPIPRRTILGLTVFRAGVMTTRLIPLQIPDPSTCATSQGWNQCRLSNAVVDGALTEFAACYNRAKAGLRTAENLSGVVSAAKLFFAHLEEIGVNRSTEPKVLGSFSEIMGFVPTDKILRQFADILRNTAR